MKMRLVIEVPLPTPEGADPGDFHPNLQYDTQQVERTLPVETVLISAEYVPEKEDAKAIFKKLIRMKLESEPLRGFKSSDYYSKGDEDAPFFSESYLYPLLGKEDARTVLSYINNLMRFQGLDPMDVHREVSAEIAAEKKAEAERKERVAKRRAFIDDYAKKKGWPPRDSKSIIGFPDDKWAEIKVALKEAGL
jgi:hypothetical protein